MILQRMLNAVTTPNPLPSTLTERPPLVAELLGLASLTAAASYDTKLLTLPRCRPTVTNTKPTPDPAPTPRTTRATITLSLLQTLASAPVPAVELDAVEEERRRRPLKPAPPNPLPNTLTERPPLVAELLGLASLTAAASNMFGEECTPI